jgi:hypothetical protein
MPTIKLSVNGRFVDIDSWDADQPLLYALRNTPAQPRELSELY